MRTFILAFSLGLVGLASTVGVAATARTAEPPADQKMPRDDPNEVVCRRESVTGSRIQTRKICMTRADWVAQSRAAQDATGNMQRGGLGNSCGASKC